jgi:hypothetical protein
MNFGHRNHGTCRHPSQQLKATTTIRFLVTMAKMATLTLANIALDVQISICTYLHPSDILALRMVCHVDFQKFFSLLQNQLLSQDL